MDKKKRFHGTELQKLKDLIKAIDLTPERRLSSSKLAIKLNAEHIWSKLITEQIVYNIRSGLPPQPSDDTISTSNFKPNVEELLKFNQEFVRTGIPDIVEKCQESISNLLNACKLANAFKEMESPDPVNTIRSQWNGICSVIAEIEEILT